MIINPFPMFGWNGTFKGPFNYVAMADDTSAQSGVTISRLHYRASIDAERWIKVSLSGDLKDVMRSTDPDGAFTPYAVLGHQGKLFAAGLLISDAGTEAAIYATSDGWSWKRMAIPSSTGDLNPALRSLAAYGAYVMAIGRSGALYYTDDLGETWNRRSDLAVGGPQPRHIYGVAANAGGILVFGSITNSNGTPGASLLLHSTSPTAAFSVISHPSGGGLESAVAGNVMLIGRQRVPPSPTNRLMWSELDNLTTWTQADLISDQFMGLIFYGNDRWLAGSGYNKAWFSSPQSAQVPGKAGWYSPAEKPWDGSYPGEHPEIRTGLFTGEKFVLQLGATSPSNPARLVVSQSGLDWNRRSMSEAGLAEARYIFGARV